MPWECWCVDLIGQYTPKGKDNSQIDFMALTMINPASSWFGIAELPLVKQLRGQIVNGKELLIADEIFDKTSECIAKLVNKGQMLDMWQSQSAESALMATIHVLNHHCSHGLKIYVCILKKISRRS